MASEENIFDAGQIWSRSGVDNSEPRGLGDDVRRQPTIAVDKKYPCGVIPDTTEIIVINAGGRDCVLRRGLCAGLQFSGSSCCASAID